MGVNLLGVLSLVEVLELTLDVGSRFLVRVGAWNKDEEREVEETGSHNKGKGFVYLYISII